MIPIALLITNFRSFRETQRFDFPTKPGLYFMQGINAAEPRLEANGAGKSTIWDAFMWCWYGKTSKGLKAGDVSHWDAQKGTKVEFVFMREEDGSLNKMTRTWSPNSWTLDLDGLKTIDLAKEKDNPALTWLGLSFDAALNCLLTAQSQPMFLDLKQDAQAKLFSDVMELDRWLDYSGRASKSASAQDNRIRDAEREHARLEGELAALGRHDWRSDSDAWEKKRETELAVLEVEHEAKLAQRKALKAKLIAADEALAEARNDLRDARPEELARIREMGDAYEKQARELELELAREEAADDTLYDLIKQLTEANACPACGQAMTAAHRDAELRKAKSKRDSVEYTLDQLGDRLRDLRNCAGECDKGYKELKAKVDGARDALEDAQREYANQKRALDLLDRELDAIEDDSDKLTESKNPYASAEARERDEGVRIKRALDDVRECLDTMTAKHSMLSFWVRGFKEVRLSLIAEALTELEVEVNSSVDALGLLGWELQFQVDRETKSGSIQRGFNCMVRSPNNDLTVPWEAWSGGEGQRLRIAGNMGLADLIRSRTGTTIPFEVWDEPTAGLSAQGIRDLLECLSVRAQREKRTIWVVDHRTHSFGGFEGGALITKGRNGSTISNGYI